MTGAELLEQVRAVRLATTTFQDWAQMVNALDGCILLTREEVEQANHIVKTTIRFLGNSPTSILNLIWLQNLLTPEKQV